MLANSLADVVAEGAAKRLLLDLNLERKAKKAERIGIGVARRLALVQADIWTKRGAADDIYELEPLVVAEETCSGKLAQQRHLLIRHNRGLKCRACNMDRADRQLVQFLEPSSPNKKRQHNESFEKESYPCTSSVSQDIQGTHSHVD